MTEVPDASAPGGPEVAQLDYEIAALTSRLEQLRREYWEGEAVLRATRQRRDDIAFSLSTPPGEPAGTPTDTPTEAPSAAPDLGTTTGAVPEASTRTVQNLLFILGGLLLGTAAIVFTAVAWARYGVVGRAVILAAVTGVALTVPPVALWRRLTATAETFAGVGLLLVVLDGYAAWYVDLLGVRDLPATRYAGLVCAVTAAVAAGYGRLTGLTGPRFAALVVAQPALPLLVAEADPEAAQWSLVFGTVALIDLAVVLWYRRSNVALAAAIRATAWTLYAAALAASAAAALVAEQLGTTPRSAALAGASVVVVGLLVVCASTLTRSTAFQALSGCLLVLAIVFAAGRLVAVVWPAYTLVLVAAVVAVVAILVAAAARKLPSGVRPGPVIGSLVAAGGVGVVVLGLVLEEAARTIAAALPAWHAVLTEATRAVDWQLTAAVVFVTAAFVAILPRTARPDALAVGTVFLALAVPSAVTLRWWAPSIVDLVVAAGLAAAAVLARSATAAHVRGWSAAVLVANAVAASLARPESTAAVLGILSMLGILVAALSRSTVDGFPAHRRAVGGAGLLVGLLAFPPAVGATLVAMDVVPWWVARLTAGAVVLALVALVLVRRWWPALTWYAFAAVLASAVIWTTVPALGGTGESLAIYAAVGLLLLAVAQLPMRRLQPVALRTGAVAAAPSALLLAVAATPALVSVLVLPYSWLDHIWSGRPAGVALAPPGVDWRLGSAWRMDAGIHAVALAALGVAAVVAMYAVRRDVRTATTGLLVGGPTALVLGLVAAGAAWPSVATVSLVLGLGLVVIGAIAPFPRPASALAAVQGIALAGAGMAGCLPTEWSTIGALGLTIVASAAVGAAARSLGSRIAGWLTGVAAALTTAVAVTLAADLALRTAAFAVLAVAAVALAGGVALSRRRRVEATAVQAAAHAGALGALLLTVGSTGHAAAVCTLWGVVVGLRALWPATSPPARAALAAAASGCELLAWWLLLADRRVAIVEAYTLPLAGVALLAGWAALRARPDLRSWVAYGPALCAAFLPSLATIIGTQGEPLRRLLLGAGALAVVVVGSVRRQQAPVVIGGTTLTLVALHEIVLVWDRLPRWIPLAIGGLILVGLAITYERRRRDVARIREAVARMR